MPHVVIPGEHGDVRVNIVEEGQGFFETVERFSLVTGEDDYGSLFAPEAIDESADSLIRGHTNMQIRNYRDSHTGGRRSSVA